MQSVIEQSLYLVEKVMNCRASSLMLLDEKTGDLIVSGARGPVGEQVQGERLPKGMGIAGWVAENKKPYYSNNPKANEIFGGDISERFTTRNITCVPLYDSDDEVIGVLQAINRRHTGFSNSDVSILETLAENIVISIKRTKRLQELEKNLELERIAARGFRKSVGDFLNVLSEEFIKNRLAVKNETGDDLLQKVYTHIEAINKYMDTLFPDSNKSVDLKIFLKDLVEVFTETGILSENQYMLSIDRESVQVDRQQLVFLGLLISELIGSYDPEGKSESKEVLKLGLAEQSENSITLLLSGTVTKYDYSENSIITNLTSFVDGLEESDIENGFLFTIEIEN